MSRIDTDLGEDGVILAVDQAEHDEILLALATMGVTSEDVGEGVRLLTLEGHTVIRLRITRNN